VDLDGKNVVITGGSAGIGAGLAHECAERGARVLVAARSESKLRAVADRIVGDHLVADLGDAAEVDAFIPRCLDILGHIDVLVNNAGIETSTSFATADRNEIRALARLNFEAPLLLTRDVLPHMLRRGSGHIVQMASVAGAIPFPGLAAYSGSKAGLTNFTETLRIELKATLIGLTVVSPGPVLTEMWERLDNDGKPFAAAGLKRFRRLGFLPKLSVDKLVDATVDAIEADKRFVRLPKRYGGYHALSNAPRRLVEGALLGVKFPPEWETHIEPEGR
jgi:short-subunit dehydrogenase